MPRTYLTASVLHTAATVLALSVSSPVWSIGSAGRVSHWETTQSPSESVARFLPTLPYQLAMMDMDEMGGMGSAKMGDNMQKTPPDGAMSNMPPSNSMQGTMTAPSGMDMMGRMRGSMQEMRGMRNMAPNDRMSAGMAASSLPGFPGASHLYHIGSTGFFLDHPQHITLTATQQTNLNKIKEKVLLERASADRRVEEAEQQLWTLTAADSPDAGKIEAKVREIEKLRSDQRLNYIRAVGEAGRVLTAEQQASLLGTKPPVGTQPATNK